MPTQPVKISYLTRSGRPAWATATADTVTQKVRTLRDRGAYLIRVSPESESLASLFSANERHSCGW